MALPSTAPSRLPRPPTTIAVSRLIDSTSVTDDGAASRPTMASMQPPTPAHAALTTKARTRARPRLMPASAAATSSSRTARQVRPYRLVDQVGQQPQNQQRQGPAQIGHVGPGVLASQVGEPLWCLRGPHLDALVATQEVRGVGRQTWQPNRQRQCCAGEVGPVQAGRGRAHYDTDESSHQHRGEHDDEERHLRVPVQEHRCRVAADCHQRPVAQGDLAVQPGQHGQARDGRQVVGHGRELRDAERLDRPQQHDHEQVAEQHDQEVEGAGGQPVSGRRLALRPSSPRLRRTARQVGAAAPPAGSRGPTRSPGSRRGSPRRRRC